ncbi:hypothetical protein BURPSPAST_R0266 [Burkholderia pseudomallei Pasteur 52237]|nr:hypothetical protein BURPSPAST_R0266 [Burkholderia pseudomallei Pasteur 52237]
MDWLVDGCSLPAAGAERSAAAAACRLHRRGANRPHSLPVQAKDRTAPRARSSLRGLGALGGRHGRGAACLIASRPLRDRILTARPA